MMRSRHTNHGRILEQKHTIENMFLETFSRRYVGKHKDFMGKRGHIISGGVKRARSIIRVRFSDKIAYLHKKSLEIINDCFE